MPADPGQTPRLKVPQDLRRVLFVTGGLGARGGVSHRLSYLAATLRRIGVRPAIIVNRPIVRDSQNLDRTREAHVPVISIGSLGRSLSNGLAAVLAVLPALIACLLPSKARKRIKQKYSVSKIAHGLWWRFEVFTENHFDLLVRICCLFWRPQVIHVFCPDEVTRGAIRGARKQRIPVVFSDTGEALPGLPSYSEEVVRTVPLADLIIVMCSHVAENARRLYGHNINVTVVPPLVPELPAAPSRRPDETVSLCYAGRLAPEKNLYGLLQALALLEPEGPKWRLQVRGEGLELERCRDFASDSGLADRVAFSGPYRLMEDFPQMAAETDLFVIPSETEGYGLIFLEVAASGRPLVATPVGAAHAVVCDGETGFLSEGVAPNQIADALRRAFARRADLPQMGANARRRFEAEHNHGVILGTMIGHYVDLIRHKQGGMPLCPQTRTAR